MLASKETGGFIKDLFFQVAGSIPDVDQGSIFHIRLPLFFALANW